MERIPVSKPYYPEEDIEEIVFRIKNILKKGHLVDNIYLREFENKFSEYIGISHAAGVNSGTAALEVALRSINVEGKDVITTTNSCTSVTNAVIFAGGKPVLVDIREDTIAMDPEKLKESITNKTKAVIIVHIAGFIQKDIKEIIEICRDKNLLIIEDCARALGAKYDKKMAGTFGDIACFSFYAPKLMSTGNGGMIVTNKKGLIKKAKIIRRYGRIRKRNLYDTITLGNNCIMNEIEAVLGIYQLKRIEEFINKRRQIAAGYDQIIDMLDYLHKLPDYQFSLANRPVYYRYPILLKEEIDADVFENYMNKNNVMVGHYYPMIHQTDLYRREKLYTVYSDLEVSEKLSKRLFSLPVFSMLTEEGVIQIMEVLKSFSY